MTLTQYLDVIAEKLNIGKLPDRLIGTYLEAFALHEGVDVSKMPNRLYTTYLEEILKARGVQSADRLRSSQLEALAKSFGATNLPDKLISTCLEAIIEGIVSIPKEYTAVPYIQSTGTQYIDTGFKPNNNTRVVIDAEFTSVPSATSALLGARVTATESNYALLWASSLNIRSDYNNVYTQTWDAAPNVRRLYDKNKETTVVAGTAQSYTNEAFQTPHNLYLCAVNNGGVTVWQSSIRIYSCKIYDNGTLVRDFIPCCRISDGTAGLYDLVTKEFFGNAGTGEFVCEKPFAVEYEKVEYIQSTGNQYIDTGVVIEDLTSHYKLQIDMTVDGATGETSTSNVNGYMGINGGIMLTLTKNNGFGISSSAGVPWVKGKRYDAVIERTTDAMRVATIDGTYFESSKQGNVYLDRPFGIFALSPFDGGFYTVYGKLYSFKAWKNNELIRHLVPCKRKSDGEVGMYDAVTKTFFINVGTGEFLYA